MGKQYESGHILSTMIYRAQPQGDFEKLEKGNFI